MLAGKWSDFKNAVLSCVQTAPFPSLEIKPWSLKQFRGAFPPCVQGCEWFSVEAAGSEQPCEMRSIQLGQGFVVNVSSGYAGGMQEEFWRAMLELPLLLALML